MGRHDGRRCGRVRPGYRACTAAHAQAAPTGPADALRRQLVENRGVTIPVTTEPWLFGRYRLVLGRSPRRGRTRPALLFNGKDRHIHATTLLLAGVPVHVVAARLGHADPAITLRVYAHVIHEQAATVAEVFACALSGRLTHSP
ncbi:tyrosine-type recombinase/integrase [Nonomuraea polychroma]|uniref:tyrosine-type recombinase/integrase n=1 Tax=Nonomuraea polychroma TaxID=46176 RepID=UPI001F4E3C70|nr:tyrosine-type recombinase/integrase [Nonomuraea polychroma]